MMFPRSLLACVVGLSILGAATPLLHSRDVLLKPKDDPFYVPPINLDDYRPGDIIRSRPTPGPIGAAQNITSVNIQGAYQLFYRTTDAIGHAAAAMTTVLVPYNAQYDKLVAYAAAYDSSDNNCSPSYTLQKESNVTSYDPLFMAALLEEGWVVTTADYEGLDAAFVAGVQSGQMNLDAIRATLASEHITGVFANATYALWGYSGGALASEWAVELQPSYAPELTIAGAAMGGLTPNVLHVLAHVTNTTNSDIAFAGINGLGAAYPNVSAFLDTALIPSRAQEFRSINFACSNDTGADARMKFADYAQYFTARAAVFDAPVPASVAHWGATMGLRDTPRAPLFVYKAVGDEVSPIADTDALVAKYCAAGATIEYNRNGFGEHVSEAVLGSGGAFAFLYHQLNGLPVRQGVGKCVTNDVFITPLQFPALAGFGAEIVAILIELLQLPMGPLSIKGI